MADLAGLNAAAGLGSAGEAWLTTVQEQQFWFLAFTACVSCVLVGLLLSAMGVGEGERSGE